MVIYDLQCPSGHAFEGWFRSADDFQNQSASGQLQCPVCADSGVIRVPSASRISRGAKRTPEPSSARDAGNAPGPSQRREFARALHRFVATHFENVGDDFAREARRMHYGDSEERAIRGEATASEVRELHEDGIAALPLPVADPDKLN